MKRSTASWTTAIAASALLAMPVGSWAQQTSPTPSQPTSSRPAEAQSSANEDLRKAEAALNDIPEASLTGTAKSRVAELKRHITALERTASSGKSSSASAGKASPSTELAAADRILTELLGGEGTTGATEPSPVGTSGKQASKAAPGVDETAKAKLQEVRTHLTAFAASMGGSTPSPSPTPRADDPSTGASAAAAAAAASPSSTAASATPSSSTPSASPAAPSSSSQSSTTASPSPATTPAPSEPAAQAQAAQQPPAAAQSVDTDAVKRHLTAARDSLSQLTQLPAAGQLTGDARTQVSQLISNFNELITTNSEWRASYTKVQANLNALVGEQRADESPAPAAGAAGAVGTSGATALDPGIRAKLVEFRTHLMDFEKAAGGASATASPTASPATPTDSAAAAQPSTPAATPSTPSTPAATPSEPAPTPAPTTPAEPSPVGTSGRSSTPTATAGTTGTTTPTAAPTTPRPSADHQAMQSEAMRHIEAIEAILNGAGTAVTAGSTASKPTAGASSLDREQIEQIRTHLAALRKALNKSDK